MRSTHTSHCALSLTPDKRQASQNSRTERRSQCPGQSRAASPDIHCNTACCTYLAQIKPGTAQHMHKFTQWRAHRHPHRMMACTLRAASQRHWQTRTSSHPQPAQLQQVPMPKPPNRATCTQPWASRKGTPKNGREQPERPKRSLQATAETNALPCKTLSCLCLETQTQTLTRSSPAALGELDARVRRRARVVLVAAAAAAGAQRAAAADAVQRAGPLAALVDLGQELVEAEGVGLGRVALELHGPARAAARVAAAVVRALEALPRVGTGRASAGGPHRRAGACRP